MNYKPNKFAEMLGVSVKTLQRWDVDGKLKAYRTLGGRRFYTDEQYSKYMETAGIQRKEKEQTNER